MTTELVKNDHFTDLRSQIAKIKEQNEKTVFDYETKKGNKEARSHVATLRKSKTAIATRHKEKKAQILEDGRAIDAGKNELTADIEEMIEVHAAPLKRIKDREDAAIQAAKDLETYLTEWDEALAEDDLFNRERDMRIKEETARFEDMKRKAEENEARLKKEQAERDERLKKEAAEEARLKAESDAEAEKERTAFLADFDEAIAINNTVNAERARKKAESDKIAAEEKAEQEKKDAAERERLAEERRVKEKAEAEEKRLADIKAAEEKAELKRQADIKAEQDKQAAIEKTRKDAANKKAKEDAARAADKEHRAKINNEAKAGLIALGITDYTAMEIVKAIVMGTIKNVSLKY